MFMNWIKKYLNFECLNNRAIEFCFALRTYHNIGFQFLATGKQRYTAANLQSQYRFLGTGKQRFTVAKYQAHYTNNHYH